MVILFVFGHPYCTCRSQQGLHKEICRIIFPAHAAFLEIAKNWMKDVTICKTYHDLVKRHQVFSQSYVDGD